MSIDKHVDNCIKSLDLAIEKINGINNILKTKIPICHECESVLTFKEVQERLNNGLNVYGEDIVCDGCWEKFINEKDDTTSPFFCDDSKQL